MEALARLAKLWQPALSRALGPGDGVDHDVLLPGLGTEGRICSAYLLDEAYSPRTELIARQPANVFAEARIASACS